MIRRLLVISFQLLVCSGTCTGSDRRNPNCEWPKEIAVSLDLRNPSHQQHLSNDALLAEDLAIRYADMHWGQRSGHYAGAEVYVRKRDTCMSTLFSTIAKNHDVTTQQVRESLLRRSLSFDAAVLLSFAALYWIVAGYVARRLSRRFPLRESLPAAMALTAVTSVGVSFVGTLLGETWSFFAEGIRLGNQHLSYRAARIPWVNHRPSFFLACLLLYLLASAFHYRIQDKLINGRVSR